MTPLIGDFGIALACIDRNIPAPAVAHQSNAGGTVPSVAATVRALTGAVTPPARTPRERS